MKTLPAAVVRLSVVVTAIAACGDGVAGPGDEGPETFCAAGSRADPAAYGLVGRLDLPGQVLDLWGLRHPADGRDYALVGFGSATPAEDGTGVHIVDVTDPADPELVSTVTGVGGFDIKSRNGYMYSVTGGERSPGAIVDIADPGSPEVVGEFPGSHNLFVTDDGLLILSHPGLRIYDLVEDPEAPRLLWSDGSDEGHEAAVVNGVLYDFHGLAGTRIYDLADPSDPALLSTIAPGRDTVRFHHSGWVTEDDSLLVITDERPGGPAGEGPDFTVWDVSDETRPAFLASFRDPTATVHNVHIVGNLAFFAYYTAGFRVFDLCRTPDLEPGFEFDTAPAFEGQGFFVGAWGVYGLSPTGNVYISDTENGLHIFGR